MTLTVTPKRLTTGPIVNFGYEGEVLFAADGERANLREAR